MISTIFDKIYNESDMIEFHISVSYFEIYMEKVKDLLNRKRPCAPTCLPNIDCPCDAAKNDNMNIREHPQRGIYVDGAREILVSSPDDVSSLQPARHTQRLPVRV